jgi:hypothetical protein
MYRLRIHETLCRSFFPAVEQRLKMRIPITPEFTAIVTGHGKTKYCLHRFKIADNPMCPCNEGMQTYEHIIYVCTILESQRSSLIKQIMARGGDWPPHQRRTGSQIFKCVFKIHQIYRLSETELDNPCTRPERNSSSCVISSDIFITILL